MISRVSKLSLKRVPILKPTLLRGVLSRKFGISDKIKLRLEEWADRLAHGDPEEPEPLPDVYNSAIEEVVALRDAVGETNAEIDWLHDRKEELYASIEIDRLRYFDTLLGTNTYFRKTQELEKRYSVNYIIQKTSTKQKMMKVDYRYTDVRLENQVQISQREFLRPTKDIEEKIEDLESYKLPTQRQKYTSSAGTKEVDYFSYLRPSDITDKQKLDVLSFIINESSKFQTFVNSSGIFQRISRELNDTLKFNKFFEDLPLFYKHYIYKMGADNETLWRAPASKITDKNLLEESVDYVDQVFATEELRFYFFNFKDQVSFQLCRYLKNNEITGNNLLGFQLDPSEEYIALQLQIGTKYLITIKKISKNRYLDYYLVSNSPSQMVFNCQQENDSSTELICLTEDQFGPNRKMISINLKKAKWIDPSLDIEETLTSVVAYMDKYGDRLIDNESKSSQIKQIWQSQDDSANNTLIKERNGFYFVKGRVINNKDQIEILQLDFNQIDEQNQIEMKPVYVLQMSNKDRK